MKKLIVLLILIMTLTSCDINTQSKTIDIVSNYTNEEIVIVDKKTTNNSIEYEAKIPARKDLKIEIIQDPDTDEIETNYIDMVTKSYIDEITHMCNDVDIEVEYDDGFIFTLKNTNAIDEFSVIFVNIDSMIHLNLTKNNKIQDNVDIQWNIKFVDSNKIIKTPKLSTNNYNRNNVSDTLDYLKQQM